MARILSVANWSRFEKSDSKKCARMSWVAVPIDHNGLGFIEIMSRPDGIRIIGGWLLILQVAATCPVRGKLVSDSGRVLGAREIALKTRASEQDISTAIEVLCENGWLISEGHPEDIRKTSGQHPDHITLQDNTLQDKTEQSSQKTAKALIDSDLFDVFWNAYGKKVGKAESMAAWTKLSAEDRQAAADGAEAYVAAHPDAKYRKDPVRYLKGKRWTDEAPEDQPTAQDDLRGWKTGHFTISDEQLAECHKITAMIAAEKAAKETQAKQ